MLLFIYLIGDLHVRRTQEYLIYTSASGIRHPALWWEETGQGLRETSDAGRTCQSLTGELTD